MLCKHNVEMIQHMLPSCVKDSHYATVIRTTVNLRVLVEKFTPRIVYVKSGVDFYAQTDIKSCRLEIGIPDVSYSQFPSVFQRSKFCKTRLLAKFSHRTAI